MPSLDDVANKAASSTLKGKAINLAVKMGLRVLGGLGLADGLAEGSAIEAIGGGLAFASAGTIADLASTSDFTRARVYENNFQHYNVDELGGLAPTPAPVAADPTAPKTVA